MKLTGGYSIAVWHETPDTWEHYFNYLFSNVLLKSGDKYYTFENNEFVEIQPTEENFQEHSISSEDIIAHYKELENPYIAHWSEEMESSTLNFTGNIDAINRFNDIRILGYTNNEGMTSSGEVSGIIKDNYYKYRVTINDTTTTQDPDDVLKDWTDWITYNSNESITVPAGYVNKVNPYIINVDVEQLNDTKLSSNGQVVLYNQDPIFILGVVSFNTLSATIDDPDGDRVQYKILLNNEKVYPEESEWSDLMQTPYPIIQKLDKSKINVGIVNSCIVKVKDEFGAEASLDLSFVGSYDGLLFADKNGEYYSLDPETILKRLDFGTIIAGFDSDIAEVRLINQNYFKVKNINVTLDKSEIQPYTNVLISKTGSGNFNPQNSLLFTEEIDSSEEVKFYVKVQTDMLAGGFSTFGIQTQAEIVED